MQNSMNVFDSIDILVMNTVQDKLLKIISTDQNAFKNTNKRKPLFRNAAGVNLGGKFSSFLAQWISGCQIDL